VTAERTQDERRSYRRVQAHVTVRPVSILARAIPRRVNDVSLGGLRCYSDDRYPVGKRLELELFFDGDRSAIVLAEVVWLEELPAGAPARYDVGVRYIDCSEQSLILLQSVLQAAPAEPR
jgi:hypothetical protein